MARITYLEIPSGLEELYYKGIKPADRYVTSRVVKSFTLLSRKRIKGLRARSLLPQIRDLWNALSSAEKAAWSLAGAEMSRTGYRLFVQDQTQRIKNNLSGTATPSLLHQSFVGNLFLGSVDPELKIIQLHPRNYWISSPVRGKKGMRELVEITEDFALPFKISLNYKADLWSADPPLVARFYAVVWHSYQGRDIFTELEINLDDQSDWKYAEATLSSVLGYVVGYNLYIHIDGWEGNLYIDNVKAEHSGQNWVRDTYCKDIHHDFTRAFFQVPKHWSSVTLSAGSWFESFYIDF